MNLVMMTKCKFRIIYLNGTEGPPDGLNETEGAPGCMRRVEDTPGGTVPGGRKGVEDTPGGFSGVRSLIAARPCATPDIDVAG